MIGIDNKPFEIVLNWKCIKPKDILGFTDGQEVEVISEPIKTHWIYDILYYLSLGMYDKRGYIYKVKIVK